MRAINVAASHRQRQNFILFRQPGFDTEGKRYCRRVLREPSRVAIGQGFDETHDIHTTCVCFGDHLDHK